jgi:hypothetical protein
MGIRDPESGFRTRSGDARRGDIFDLKDKGKCGLLAFLQIGFMR